MQESPTDRFLATNEAAWNEAVQAGLNPTIARACLQKLFENKTDDVEKLRLRACTIGKDPKVEKFVTIALNAVSAQSDAAIISEKPVTPAVPVHRKKEVADDPAVSIALAQCRKAGLKAEHSESIQQILRIGVQNARAEHDSSYTTVYGLSLAIERFHRDFPQYKKTFTSSKIIEFCRSAI